MPGCLIDVSQNFVFESPSFQRGCNTIYEEKKAFDLANNATITGKTFKFKTDFERMQNLIGLYGSTPVPSRFKSNR
jgi:hypothetical protein